MLIFQVEHENTGGDASWIHAQDLVAERRQCLPPLSKFNYDQIDLCVCWKGQLYLLAKALKIITDDYRLYMDDTQSRCV